jgi:hypothetical protein
MKDIAKIPTKDLFDDRSAALLDIEICKLALVHGVMVYGMLNDSVQDRLDSNLEQVKVINAELDRRERGAGS